MVSFRAEGKAANLFAVATIAFVAGKRVSPALGKGRSYDPYPAIDAAEFGQRIQRILNLYDWQVTLAQLNILDSHDTARLISLARGDKTTLRLATLFQMTFPGAPSVYYGDEIGLRGTLAYDKPHQDPDARWAFPWHDRGQWDTDLLSFFKAAIALRHAHRVLRRGHFYPLHAQGDVFVFARRDDEETLIVALNVGDGARQVRVPVGAYFRDGLTLQTLLTSNAATSGSQPVVEDGQVTLDLPAREGIVLSAT